MKTFTVKRFGFKFRMFINNEVITACIVRLPGYNYDMKEPMYTGVAKVKAPDIYNYDLGKRIAMKSAINKYSSYRTGLEAQAMKGFKNQMKQVNGKIVSEINELRKV